MAANFTNERATLYGSEGDKGFFNIPSNYGVHGPTVGQTSFGVGCIDSLNRGVLDLFLANGAVNIEPGAMAGPGLALEEVSRSAGLPILTTAETPA